MKVITFFLILLLPLGIFAQSEFQFIKGENKVDLRVKIRNNLVIVPVEINGHSNLWFVLDTGVKGIIVTDKRYIEALRLKSTEKVNISAPGAIDSVGAFVVNHVNVRLEGVDYEPRKISQRITYHLDDQNVNISRVESENQSVLVLEKDYLDLSGNLGMDVCGIIGYPLFSRFVVKIDYDYKVVSLIDPKKYSLTNQYVKIPLNIENTKPYISARVQNINNQVADVKLLIDSGASHALLLDTESSKVLSMPEKTMETSLGHGLAGEIEGSLGRIKNLWINTFSFENVIASFPKDGYYPKARYLNNRNGTIGGEILKRFNPVFHYFDSSLYLVKSASYKNKFEYDMTGISHKSVGSKLDKMLVTRVKEHSPASKAGIKIGDAIIKVNRHKVSSITLDPINTLFRSQPNKTIKVKILRGGEKLQKVFKLERLI